MTSNNRYQAVRGPTLTCTDDPFKHEPLECFRYEADGMLVIDRGRYIYAGPYSEAGDLSRQCDITQYPQSNLILPGFIDLHCHYAQIGIMGGYGEQLLDWLERYAYPAEQELADYTMATRTAGLFLDSSLKAGTTTPMVYCTVHPHSVDALFSQAQNLGQRLIAGKVLMDRNAPGNLTDDSARSGYDESLELIRRWHDVDRLSYAITPRFAGSCSPQQLTLAGALWKENPGTYVQSHLAENQAEVEWMRALYPDRRNYLDIYDHHGLLGEKSVYGHCIWLDESELSRLHETGTAIAHCPTSNRFLGSGHFSLRAAKQKSRQVHVGAATDVGAGTSLSMLRTLGEAYQTASLAGDSLHPVQALYLATLGAARCLHLDGNIGTLTHGKDADFIVLDLHSTPLISHRMDRCEDVLEAFFVQTIMGDDRAVSATYIGGHQYMTPQNQSDSLAR